MRFQAEQTEIKAKVASTRADIVVAVAKDKLLATLAGRDTLESSVGANALSQLDKTRNNAAVDIGNAATDASNGLRSKVDTTKTNLYSLNASAADPLTSASRGQALVGQSVTGAQDGTKRRDRNHGPDD